MKTLESQQIKTTITGKEKERMEMLDGEEKERVDPH